MEDEELARLEADLRSLFSSLDLEWALAEVDLGIADGHQEAYDSACSDRRRLTTRSHLECGEELRNPLGSRRCRGRRADHLVRRGKPARLW